MGGNEERGRKMILLDGHKLPDLQFDTAGIKGGEKYFGKALGGKSNGFYDD